MTHSELLVRQTTTNKLGIVSLVIPRRFAKDLGIARPTEVIIEKKPEGLLIRKLEVI